VFQIERGVDHSHRSGAEGGRGSVSRASTKSGVTGIMAISSVENGVARRGLMVVISSPSGAGKSTIARLLLEDKKMNLSLSISVTTRQRRPSEIEGVHYHFKTIREFERLRDN